MSTVIGGRVGFPHIFSFLVVSERIFNRILAGLGCQRFDSNGFESNVFLFQLSRIFESIPANSNPFLSVLV